MKIRHFFCLTLSLLGVGCSYERTRMGYRVPPGGFDQELVTSSTASIRDTEFLFKTRNDDQLVVLLFTGGKAIFSGDADRNYTNGYVCYARHFDNGSCTLTVWRDVVNGWDFVMYEIIPVGSNTFKLIYNYHDTSTTVALGRVQEERNNAFPIRRPDH